MNSLYNKQTPTCKDGPLQAACEHPKVTARHNLLGGRPSRDNIANFMDQAAVCMDQASEHHAHAKPRHVVGPMVRKIANFGQLYAEQGCSAKVLMQEPLCQDHPALWLARDCTHHTMSSKQLVSLDTCLFRLRFHRTVSVAQCLTWLAAGAHRSQLAITFLERHHEFTGVLYGAILAVPCREK